MNIKKFLIIVIVLLVGINILVLSKINQEKIKQESLKETEQIYQEIEKQPNEEIEKENLINNIEEKKEKGNSSKILPSDYGKVVTNYTEGEQVWEVFYADNDNIYLITQNIVSDPIYNKKTLSDIIGDKTYIEGSALLSDNTRFPAAQKWLIKYINFLNDSSKNSKNRNIQATLFMLDSTKVWNDTYKNEYADYAIGSPTIEMLVEAYNKVNNDEKISCLVETVKGYDYGNIKIDAFELNSVFRHGKEESYWLASPFAHNPYLVLNVNAYYGYVYRNFNTAHGFRPVVCLNSSVILEKSEDNTSFIIKNT